MSKRIVRLTEADIENIVKTVIKEQTEEVILNKLNDRIEAVIMEKQEQILDETMVSIESKDMSNPYQNNMILKIANTNIPITPSGRQGLWVRENIPSKKYVTGSIPLSDFYGEIFSDEELERYYNENQYIKDQMDSLKVPLDLTVESGNKITVVQQLNKRKNRKSSNKPYVKGDKISLGEFFSNGGAQFGVLKKVMLSVEFGGLSMKLGSVARIHPNYDTESGKVTGDTSTGDTTTITIPTFSVEGSSLPYADNMVMPYFDRYEGSVKKFNEILDAFIKYINAGGGKNLNNVTIKGSADSGTPTLKVPSGYGNKLDHPGTPYDGLKNPKQMNQYLADMRAEQYAKVLIDKVKEKTGFDLKIKVLPGDNYYGQGEGKRGIEYRKITLTPNAPEFKPKKPSSNN